MERETFSIMYTSLMFAVIKNMTDNASDLDATVSHKLIDILIMLNGDWVAILFVFFIWSSV